MGKIRVRCFVGVVLSIMIITNATVVVEAETKMRLWSDRNYTYELRAVTYIANAVEREITDSRAKHYYGEMGPVLTVDKAVTASVTRTLGASVKYSAKIVEVNNDLGLGTTNSCTVGTSVAYTVPKSKPTGIYAIKVVFPGKKVQYVVRRKGKYEKNFKTVYKYTQSYLPRIKDRYKDYGCVG